MSQRLIVEFNEPVLSQYSAVIFKKLKALSVKLTLDDYGANLLSFYYYHGCPFKFIKLDGHLIKTLNGDSNLSLVKALY